MISSFQEGIKYIKNNEVLKNVNILILNHKPFLKLLVSNLILDHSELVYKKMKSLHLEDITKVEM